MASFPMRQYIEQAHEAMTAQLSQPQPERSNAMTTQTTEQPAQTREKAEYVGAMHHKGVKYAVLLKGETYLVYSKDRERISSGKTQEQAVKRAHAKLYAASPAEKNQPAKATDPNINKAIADAVASVRNMSPQRAKQALATWLEGYVESDHESLSEYQAAVLHAFTERLTAA